MQAISALYTTQLFHISKNPRPFITIRIQRRQGGSANLESIGFCLKSGMHNCIYGRDSRTCCSESDNKFVEKMHQLEAWMKAYQAGRPHFLPSDQLSILGCRE